MDRRSTAVLSLSVVMVLALLVPVGALAKGKPVAETTNNLSFPAIAVDGFTPNTVTTPSFTVPYTGDYPGLTAEEIAVLQATGPWYAQKVTGNSWGAEWASQDAVNVDIVDWGDNIESVDAFVRRPYRLEVVLFDDTLAETMTGYTMAMLGNPSSPDEIQGTNDNQLYEGTSATVISSKPKLVIQALGTTDPTTLTWNVATSRWMTGEVALPVTPIGFAPELNVAGKYIYGASTGGWKPTVAGVYRVTFYIPTDSGVNLRLATIPVPVEEEVTVEAEEGGGATPQIDSTNNLTYVDITVRPRTR